MQKACTSMSRSCTAQRLLLARAQRRRLRNRRTVDDLVADEALQEDAHEAHQPVLHVLVLRTAPCQRPSAAAQRNSWPQSLRALMFSQDEMQLEMYRCTNSIGSSTAVVSRLTTSMECRLMSMLTSTEKYSLIWLDACRSAGSASAQHGGTWRNKNAP